MRDMLRIMNACDINKKHYIKTQKEIYIESRDKIAHVLLKLFGLKTSHLKYIKLENLDSLFAGIGFVIELEVNNTITRTYFPYLPEMEKLLSKVRPNYLILKDFIIEEKRNRITVELVTTQNKVIVSNALKKNESEIWSAKMVKNYYVKRINSQLKKVFKKKEKIITSYAYKRSASQIIERKFGVKLSRQLLKCSNEDTLRGLLRAICEF